LQQCECAAKIVQWDGYERITSRFGNLDKLSNLRLSTLGEAYMDNGDKKLAIKNYQKSLEFNPGNANGVERLRELTAQ
jgi:hypothetical protein